MNARPHREFAHLQLFGLGEHPENPSLLIGKALGTKIRAKSLYDRVPGAQKLHRKRGLETGFGGNASRGFRGNSLGHRGQIAKVDDEADYGRAPMTMR